jgi:hypothetical protein
MSAGNTADRSDRATHRVQGCATRTSAEGTVRSLSRQITGGKLGPTYRHALGSAPIAAARHHRARHTDDRERRREKRGSDHLPIVP